MNFYNLIGVIITFIFYNLCTFRKKIILNVPHLRFPEFSGEWRTFNANDVLKSFPTNSLSWDQLTFNCGKIKNFHYGLIHKGLSILTEITDKRIPFLINDEDRKGKELIQKGDLIFADASEDYNGVAQAIEIISDNIPSVAGLHTIHVRENNDLMVVGFRGYLFNSSVVKEQFKRLAVGTKVYSISFKNFKDVIVNIPKDKKEQQKIINLLLSIDKRIKLQRKLIENYKSLIKIIKNVILPPKFNIKQTLKHFLLETNERVGAKSISPVAIGVLGIRKRTDIFNKELSNDYSKNKIIHNGNLCFGIGTNRIVFDILNENKTYCVSPAYKTFRIIRIKSIVLKLILDNNNQLFSKRHMIISARQGKLVNFDGLLQEPINYPDEFLQFEIESVLISFEKLLTNKYSTLNNLLSLKNCLLQNLFI